MLSDYPFHLFGRTITITGHEQFLALVFLAVAATTWVILQSRRRRIVALQRSAVSDTSYRESRTPWIVSRAVRWTRPLPRQPAASKRTSPVRCRFPCSAGNANTGFATATWVATA